MIHDRFSLGYGMSLFKKAGFLFIALIDNRSKAFIFNSKRPFLWIVAIPFILGVIYFSFFSEKYYVSEAKVLVKSLNVQSETQNESSLRTKQPGFTRDPLLLQELIFSKAFFIELDKKIGLIEHIKAGPKIGISTFFRRDLNENNVFTFYLKMVKIKLNKSTGTLALNVNAFDSDYSRLLLDEILFSIRSFLSQLDRDLQQHLADQIETELNQQKTRVYEAKLKLDSFQQKHNILDQISQNNALEAVVAELNAEKTRLETRLRTLIGYMSPDAAEVATIRNRIQAIERQLSRDNGHIGDSHLNSISDLQARYQRLKLDYKLELDTYNSLLSVFEKAKINTINDRKYLITLAPPYTSQEAINPYLGRNLIILMLVLSCVYTITKVFRLKITGGHT